MGRPKDKLNAPKKPFIARVVDQLASVKFAVTVVVIIAIACVAGTLIPQGTDVAKYTRLYPAATDRMELLGKLGLTHVFYSVWFIGLLCTLASTVAVCSSRRFVTVLRTSGYARYRAFGSMLTHISILLILTGGVIRGGWGEKGYLELREGETNANVVTEKSAKPLPFAIHLDKFEIETYDQAKTDGAGEARAKTGDRGNGLLVVWPEKNLKATLPINVGIEQAFGDFKITVLKYIPDFIVDTQTREVTSRSNEPSNPAILVAVNSPTYHNHRWLFAKFPDFTMHAKDGEATGPSPLEMVYQNHGATGHKLMPTGPIKSFKSTIKLVEGELIVGERTVEVNRPFQYKGYTFYQSGYNPNDLSYTSFQVVKDPGVPIVYSGFSLMIAGLFIVFYLNPWFDARRKAA
jgi:hypothetical protein